jgi:hypothetical protein
MQRGRNRYRVLAETLMNEGALPIIGRGAMSAWRGFRPYEIE